MKTSYLNPDQLNSGFWPRTHTEAASPGLCACCRHCCLCWPPLCLDSPTLQALAFFFFFFFSGSGFCLSILEPPQASPHLTGLVCLPNSATLFLLSCYSVTTSCQTLLSQGLQHARLLCPPHSPRVCSDSCRLSQWCYLTISSSDFLLSVCMLSLARLFVSPCGLCSPLGSSVHGIS